MAKVGTPLIEIETSGPVTAEPHGHGTKPQKTSPQAEQPTPTPQAASPHVNEQILATPATRHLAAKHRLELATVKGTGRDGRILKEDLLKILGGDQVAQGAPREAPSVTPATTTPTPQIVVPPTGIFSFCLTVLNCSSYC